MTTCSRPIRATAVARRAGSAASGGAGSRTVSTEQNRQPRVQALPATIKVAVPRAQQSCRFGQRASSQTVWSAFVSTACLVPRRRDWSTTDGKFTRSQGGRRRRPIVGDSTIGSGFGPFMSSRPRKMRPGNASNSVRMSGHATNAYRTAPPERSRGTDAATTDTLVTANAPGPRR